MPEVGQGLHAKEVAVTGGAMDGAGNLGMKELRVDE